MDKADLLVEETINKWSEWIEMMPSGDAINAILHALAVTAVRERERADWNEMALKRCEVGK